MREFPENPQAPRLPAVTWLLCLLGTCLPCWETLRLPGAGLQTRGSQWT